MDLDVNHKDGNKANNHYTNLEWCTTWYNNYHARINKLNNISKTNSQRWESDDFRKKTSKRISEGRIGKYNGDKNPSWRYDIYDKNGRRYNRHEVSVLGKKSQSYTDLSIRKLANGEKVSWLEELEITVIDTKKKSQSTIESISIEKDNRE